MASLQKKTKIILVVVIVLLVSVFAGYKYLYKSHRDIKNEAAAYEVSARQLVSDFQNNEEEATQKYLNKTLLINGNLTSVEENTGGLDNAVFFILNENQGSLTENQMNTSITVKGRCIGYDNLLEEVKLDQTTLIK